MKPFISAMSDAIDLTSSSRSPIFTSNFAKAILLSSLTCSMLDVFFDVLDHKGVFFSFIIKSNKTS
jgi:hypothetical protein